MTLFFLLFSKILPLYFHIFLGYLSVRFLAVEKGTVAAILFYIIGPVVVFHATLQVDISTGAVALPLFLYFFCSSIAFISLPIFQRYWQDATPNILAFSAGTGNTGFFGIALALALFEPHIADLFIFTVLSSFFYEATTGYYITAKATFTALESAKKVARLPLLYAFLLALALNVAGVEVPDQVLEFTAQFKILFSVLGMMVIGMGLQGVRGGGGIDRRFLFLSLSIKHVFWPLAAILIITLDTLSLRLLTRELQMVLFVFGVVPLAGNTVTLAVLFNARPEKAAVAVFISTLLSLILIPLMLGLHPAF